MRTIQATSWRSVNSLAEVFPPHPICVTTGPSFAPDCLTLKQSIQGPGTYVCSTVFPSFLTMHIRRALQYNTKLLMAQVMQQKGWNQPARTHTGIYRTRRINQQRDPVRYVSNCSVRYGKMELASYRVRMYIDMAGCTIITRENKHSPCSTDHSPIPPSTVVQEVTS